jgi:hypothetical protein
MNGKKWSAGIAAVLAVFAGGFIAYTHFATDGNSRASLLRALPPDASAVIYVDVEEFRRAAILKVLTTWGAGAAGGGAATTGTMGRLGQPDSSKARLIADRTTMLDRIRRYMGGSPLGWG